MSSVVVCTECGNESEGEEQFCESCGSYLAWWGERLDASPETVIEAEAQAEEGTVTAALAPPRPPGTEAVRRPPRTLRQAWRSVPGELICTTCEHPSPPHANFCRNCGAVLVGTPPVEVRRWRRVVRRPLVLEAGRRPGWTKLVAEGPRRVPRRAALVAAGTLLVTGLAVLFAWLWATSVGDWARRVADNVRRDVYPYYDPIRPASDRGAPQTRKNPGKAAFDRDLTTYWVSPDKRQHPRTGIGGRLIARLKPAANLDRVAIFAGDPVGQELVPSRLRIGYFHWCSAKTTVPSSSICATIHRHKTKKNKTKKKGHKKKGRWVLAGSTGITLANKPGFQTFPLAARDVGLVVITVKGVYSADSPGTAAVTEVEFFHRH